jgi:hypothetical protein
MDRDVRSAASLPSARGVRMGHPGTAPSGRMAWGHRETRALPLGWGWAAPAGRMKERGTALLRAPLPVGVAQVRAGLPVRGLLTPDTRIPVRVSSFPVARSSSRCRRQVGLKSGSARRFPARLPRDTSIISILLCPSHPPNPPPSRPPNPNSRTSRPARTSGEAPVPSPVRCPAPARAPVAPVDDVGRSGRSFAA